MGGTITREVTVRLCLFGQGPLLAAVRSALAGHAIAAVFDSPQPTEVLKAAQAQVGLSAGYRHKLRQEEWECFPDGILNIHTGYLPWNRGAYPNVWPILDGSPAGVTLHRVDEGWDTGPIIGQRKIEVVPWDTAKTLYDKLVVEGAALVEKVFRDAEAWSYLLKAPVGFPFEIPQDPKAGSFHRKTDLQEMNWEEEGWDYADMSEFKPIVKLLRAASFPGYGLRYRQNGKLIEATITLKEVTE